MKRREAKFVHASPRLAPDQIEAAPHIRETRTRRTAATGRQAQSALTPEPIRRGKPRAK